MLMAKKRILILGAGLAGLSAGWHLQKKGIDCLIFEKESEVGGLCRSKNINGFIFDYDGHLFHFRHQYVFSLIKDLLGDNLFEHQRSAWVYSYGRYIPYPFQANLYGLPPQVIKECLTGFLKVYKNSPIKNKKEQNFSKWIDLTFGKGIAKHFMVPYNTKFWTHPLQKLTCEWVNGLIPVPTLNQVAEGTIEENKREFGYSARFWYPKRGGINQVSLALASQIKNIHTNCEIIEINLKKKEIKIASGNRERFDYLIFTGPLPEMPNLIQGLSSEIIFLFRKLRWNSIFNLNLGIDKKDESRCHWIYFPQKEICFFRLGFYHNFSSYLTPLGKSSLYVEVAYSKNKPIDKDKIILHIIEDLEKVGVLESRESIFVKDINDIKYGYPIYDQNYKFTRTKIFKFLIQNNIIPCGRYGCWRYLSMEDVILDGKRVVRFLSKNV